MPISDAGVMLRPTSDSTLNSTENGTGVDMGKAPLGRDVMLRIYLPSSPTTVSIKLQHSINNSDWADTGQSWTFTAAGTYLRRVWWSRRYVRHVVTACTGSCGVATIGIIYSGQEEG